MTKSLKGALPWIAQIRPNQSKVGNVGLSDLDGYHGKAFTNQKEKQLKARMQL